MTFDFCSWIKRARWVYGSLVGEDIRNYNVLVRKMTEATGTNNTGVSDQTSITDGIGGIRMVVKNDGGFMNVNVRSTEIQVARQNYFSKNVGVPGAVDIPRRYQVQLALGLFQQTKLVPLKWMASQVAIELEMADFNECCCHSGVPDSSDSYEISNLNFVAELLEFDGTYDTAFLEGLRGGGVPIKFSSWDTFIYTPSPSTTQTILVPERNRSIKGAFCVQLPPARAVSDEILSNPANTAGPKIRIPWDSHAFVESSANLGGNMWPGLAAPYCDNGWLANFQWRLGGKYYPSQAVQCGDMSKSNGGVEAYQEYAKALNIVGDYRLSTALNSNRWCRMAGQGTNASVIADWYGLEAPDVGVAFQTGPACFVIAGDFETSDGNEVSGLNGEEQNDIALSITYGGGPQNPSFTYNVFVHYDVLLILKDNNLVELIK